MRRKDKSLDQKDGLKIVVKDLRQGMIKRRDNMRKVLKKHHPDKDIEDLNPITKKLKRKQVFLKLQFIALDTVMPHY